MNDLAAVIPEPSAMLLICVGMFAAMRKNRS
ncbi:MAG: PEP-CTERM sorting domain-containing protein [Lacipirellulaceae bacterium]